MIHGLTTAGLGQPDYELALEQHDQYGSALKECGLEVRVLLPKGFPKASHAIENAGLPVVELDVSEFRKLDGGLCCLSLRF
jgi:dimethylargininase